MMYYNDLAYTEESHCSILDMVPTMEDIGDDFEMMSFKDKHVIYGYAVVDNVDIILKDWTLATKLKIYESANVALVSDKAKELLKWSLIRISIDLEKALDLLDFKDLNSLVKYREEKLKQRKRLDNNEIIKNYIIDNKIQAIRRLILVKDGKNKNKLIWNNSSINEAYILYKIINHKCVKDIQVVTRSRV